jgi:hypothetical protein
MKIKLMGKMVLENKYSELMYISVEFWWRGGGGVGWPPGGDFWGSDWSICLQRWKGYDSNGTNNLKNNAFENPQEP